MPERTYCCITKKPRAQCMRGASLYEARTRCDEPGRLLLHGVLSCSLWFAEPTLAAASPMASILSPAASILASILAPAASILAPALSHFGVHLGTGFLRAFFHVGRGVVDGGTSSGTGFGSRHGGAVGGYGSGGAVGGGGGFGGFGCSQAVAVKATAAATNRVLTENFMSSVEIGGEKMPLISATRKGNPLARCRSNRRS